MHVSDLMGAPYLFSPRSKFDLFGRTTIISHPFLPRPPIKNRARYLIAAVKYIVPLPPTSLILQNIACSKEKKGSPPWPAVEFLRRNREFSLSSSIFFLLFSLFLPSCVLSRGSHLPTRDQLSRGKREKSSRARIFFGAE